MSSSSNDLQTSGGVTKDRNTEVAKNSRLILLILILSTVLYGSFWSYVSIAKLYALNATVFDLGITSQRGWVILHAQLPLLAYLQILFNSGIVYPLSPLTATGNYPIMLIFQAFSIAIVSPALYRISRLHGLDKAFSTITALAFFLYFPVYGIFWFDFHYQVFFLPLFIFGYLLYIEKKYMGALVLFFLSGLVRYPYSIFPLAFAFIEIILIYRKRRVGVDHNKLHVIFTLLILMFIWSLVGYTLGGLSGPIAFSSLPVNGVDQQGLFLRFFVIFLFLAPLLFISIFSPRWIIFTFPAFFLVLLSNNASYSYHLILQSQYVSGIVPFVFLGFIDVIGHIKSNKKQFELHLKFINRIFWGKLNGTSFGSVLLVALVLFNLIFAPFGPFNQNSSDNFNFHSTTNFNLTKYNELKSMINMIPNSDPYVAFQNNIPQVLPRPLPFGSTLIMGGYLGNLANFNSSSPLNNSWPIYLSNGKISNIPINYAILDAGNQYFYQGPHSLYDLVRTMYSSGSYGILSEGYGLLLLKYGYNGPIINYSAEDKVISAGSFENMSGYNSGSGPIVKTNDTSDNFMFYGPGTYLYPGSYNITFYLKTNNISQQNNIWLQVTSDSGNNVVAFEHINGTGFRNTGQWQDFSLHFFLDNIYGKVEFRGFGIEWNGTIEFNGVKVIQEYAYGNLNYK